MPQKIQDKNNTAKLPKINIFGKNIFYGWMIVAVGFVTQFIQGVVNQGFSSYADVMSVEFGWSKAALAGPRSVTSVQNSVLGPITGFLVDRFGPRVIVGAGVVITGIGLILFGMTYSLWMYYVSNIIIALGISLEGILVLSVAVNYWFRRRGTLAQSLMLLGFSMAGVLGVPMLVFLQNKMGWHHAAVWIGIGLIVVGVPCSMLLRDRPESFGLLPDGDLPGEQNKTTKNQKTEKEYDFTLREAIRTRTFWLLALGWAITSFGIGVVQIHLFLHLGENVGLNRTVVALIWSIASITNIPARLVGGFMGDRVPKNITLGIVSLIMGFSIFALAMTTSFSSALLFAIPYGIAWGITTPVMNSIQGEYFGRRSLGVIRGWLQLVSLPFSIVAPVLVGYLADKQGTYRWSFIGISFCMLVGSILIFVCTRPKPPQKSPQI
jgi:sugar phosphate permease